MRWLLDVEFKDDLSRSRAGHCAKNMAMLRRFALGSCAPTNQMAASNPDEKAAGWSPNSSSKSSNSIVVNLDSEPCGSISGSSRRSLTSPHDPDTLTRRRTHQQIPTHAARGPLP
jgi:hypothetical protein